jgi:hypothetical protein
MYHHQTESLKKDLYTQKGQMQSMQQLRIDSSSKFEFGLNKLKLLKRIKLLLKKLLRGKNGNRERNYKEELESI